MKSLAIFRIPLFYLQFFRFLEPIISIINKQINFSINIFFFNNPLNRIEYLKKKIIQELKFNISIIFNALLPLDRKIFSSLNNIKGLYLRLT